MKTNDLGLHLIETFEGCKLKAYKDIVGVLTIGYGHTGDDVKEGMVITQQQADQLLASDLAKTEKYVSFLVKVPLNSNQFSALVSFTYNLGPNALSKSTLLKKLNSKDYLATAEEFIKWNKAGGVPVAGLARRREAERELFLTLV